MAKLVVSVICSQAEGLQLNWLIARSQGLDPRNVYGHVVPEFVPDYCNDPCEGAPILFERVHTLIKRDGAWSAEVYDKTRFCVEGKGPTALIAAMRAVAVAEFGYRADVPLELLP